MERNNMDINLQKYYESRLDMMSSLAWKELMEDVQKMLDATDQLSGVTVDNLRFKQGEVSIMRWLLALADTSDKAYEQLKEEE
jgi:hypothetical protein